MSFSQPTLEEIRHSASHILAQAVLQVFPDAKLGIGPVIDDGFYYDFDLPRALVPEDLVDLEARMKAIIKEKQEFTQFDLPRAEAEARVAASDQPFKKELIEDLNKETYSFYTNGPFTDLCRGPHVQNTIQVQAFKLLKVSGAYWRGSEKNKMLQRIYGTAFHTKEELKLHLKRLEEAKKRDHRVLGKELGLFSIKDDIGSGLILWHPKGARIRHLMETYWKEAHYAHGYQLLYTPHVGKGELWKTSGHLDFYQENMYSPISVDEQDYYVRPMNCPFHILIYNDTQHSYRDLPIRYAELGTVYRFERSGVLHGLMRVRGFTQDDAHIICTQDQMHQEIKDVLTFCKDMLQDFGFSSVKTYISTRPEEKYVGDISLWKDAQTALENATSELGLSFDIDEGGGAFYGPKIDIKIEDAIGREWQCSTIQFDFNLPERFDMTYIGSDGQKNRPYMIHRALLGSIERFFGILIEHYAGRFPVWLAPTQVKLLTVNSDVADYAKEVEARLKQHQIRTECDLSSDKIGYKVRMAAKEKVPYMCVIGDKERQEGTVSVRMRGENADLGSFKLEDFIARLEGEITSKKIS